MFPQMNKVTTARFGNAEVEKKMPKNASLFMYNDALIENMLVD